MVKINGESSFLNQAMRLISRLDEDFPRNELKQIILTELPIS